MKNFRKNILFCLLLIFFVSCSEKESVKATKIGVFVPGIIADSPTYAHFTQGVLNAVEEFNSTIQNEKQKVQVSVMEAGTNQSEWATKLTALTASGEYSVIISSNPSLPELAEPLTKQFPNQKYLMLDGALSGNENIACVSYNQKEQTYLTGYISALLSKTHKVGLIAAQEYPVMNEILYPYFAQGAKDAVSGTTADFRIVGNWYDASRGQEIADAMAKAGIDVILPICGGASQGVIASAREKGIKLAYIDENSFAKAPGIVISSCSTEQEKAAKEITLDFLNGKTEWGKTKVVGLKEGYITFIQDDELYIQTVPQNVREKMQELVLGLKDESIKVPEL